MLTIVPAELQRLTNRGATASLVAVERPTTKGPTREVAKTMPQAVTKTSFNSVAEAEASGLPKGTIVTINGRKARID